ncbi:type VII secretion-associated protein [Mycobacterium crocinum]|uniref:Type VII secretion-associated protein n=1 Tax=Mycolicibacterium crocinum TaxID=388459 RepID=A0ABY3THD0_9MYCO|nr:type VII secretion-associated protein [Mycolicibacterium crocinum]MCV7216636.1 type VII secretion-associated protein [Mycolicibacterium crocinum]ULN40558.1 type VII secretion-associated protein [Mycolicibacterium crocinum]
MPTVTGAVLEVGPAAVTRLAPGQALMEPELVAAALNGIDDTVVLLRERPVAVADLWRSVIASSLEKGCEAVTLVHPSWWSDARVATVVGAAAAVVTEVQAQPRSTVLADGEAATVIEIADDLVAITIDQRVPLIRRRSHDPSDFARMVETLTGTAVLIDAPPTVPGSAEYARSVRTALRHRGVETRMVCIRAPRPAPKAHVEPLQRKRRRGPVLVATGMALTLCAIGATAARARTLSPPSNSLTVVEGRITVRIPPDWVVTRITAGPGSRRIQAASPTDPGDALHITQSYVPGQAFKQTADMLRTALNEQPGGVFVDFNPADRRGGRPAVTYRELRVAREIHWTVILDGATRISIGCQNGNGRPGAITQPCEQAIESARELSGTKSGP